ncbi:MAG: M23 family metallopeptidase, partial [Caulobacteraceae bacterium]|nr:M23 family metallopeptidase [Caulobacteraceae bacterium]
ATPAVAALPAAQDGAGLRLPIACTPGHDCAVQNHVDHDPGPAVRDYRCGSRTYQDHNGTDFRLPDQAAADRGVDVLAAAPGVVLRIRDGVPDQSVRVRGAAAVEGTECGNGLVIDHGNGLTTQYCHLASGSLAVQPGQTVAAGTVVGRVGLSGQTEYPHLHFTVRREATVIDPFQPGPARDCPAGGPSAPGTALPASLWTPEAAALMPYRPREVLNAGFTASAVTMEAIEAGGLAPAARGGPVLIAFVRALGLQAGDVEELVVTGPDGRVWSEVRGQRLTGDRAQQMVFTGRRLRTEAWPGGAWTARYRVRAGDAVVLEHRIDIRL